MTNSTKHSLMAVAVLVMSAFGGGACMAADEFGARFTDITPAALKEEPVSDNMAVAQDEPSAEELNDVAPAAGEPAENPVVAEPAVQDATIDETGGNPTEME